MSTESPATGTIGKVINPQSWKTQVCPHRLLTLNFFEPGKL
jgi:hypothetical protein